VVKPRKSTTMRCINLDESPTRPGVKNPFDVSEISSNEQLDERILLKRIRMQQKIFQQPIVSFLT